MRLDTYFSPCGLAPLYCRFSDRKTLRPSQEAVKNFQMKTIKNQNN